MSGKRMCCGAVWSLQIQTISKTRTITTNPELRRNSKIDLTTMATLANGRNYLLLTQSCW